MKVISIFFSINLLLGLIVQKILPLFAPDSFENGISKSLKDALKFQQIAVELAQNIAQNGWQVFELKPLGQFPSGILGAIYALTGIYSPVFQLIINSIFVGVSAFCLYKIFENFTLKTSWIYLGIGLVLYTPSSMGWNTQISKDIYLVTGVLLMIYGHLKVITKKDFRFGLISIVGLMLVFLVKDYWAEVLLLGYSVGFGVMLFDRKFRELKHLVFMGLFLATLVILSTVGHKKYQKTPENNLPGVSTVKTELSTNDPFYYNAQVPVLDIFLKRISYAHYKFQKRYAHGNEQYLPHVRLNSTMAAVNYLPQAITLGFFEPLPFHGRWDEGKGKGLLFLLLQIEMLMFYFAVVTLIAAYKKVPREDKILILGLSSMVFIFVLVLGYTTPNIGAINRYRFPFLMVIKILAICYMPFKQRQVLS